MSTNTPMIQQYLSIKAQVPDALLFFRLGDFYELFFEDAHIAARELEITLTARGNKGADGEERIPMCGVPHHAAEQYLVRLIKKGYKVAICEQVEDPKVSKGVVRREITRIVTPGTMMESHTLGEPANNFLCTIASLDRQWSLAACDLSTGELFVMAQDESAAGILEEASVYTPSEIVTRKAHAAEIEKAVAGWTRRPLISVWEEKDDELLFEHFADDPVFPTLSRAERECLSLLIRYLRETQKRSLSHISTIRFYRSRQYMILDPNTRRNLELVETLHARTRKGSLLWLLDETVTAIGARKLRQWIDKPLLDLQAIEERQEAVDKLYRNTVIRLDLREQLKQVYDLERLAARVAYGNANARDLNALKLSLQRVPDIAALVTQAGSGTLDGLIAHLDDCRDVASWIEEAIVDDPPVTVREGGMIRPGYHARLDELRAANQHGKQWIAELEAKEREATGIKSLKVGFNKVFGYYIEVSRANLDALPRDRYERKQTLANAERFITPELKEKEALILEAEEHIVDIEYECFLELRQKIAAEVPRLQRLAEIVAMIDVFQSLATVAVKFRYVRPQMTDGFAMEIVEGRHPVVEAVLENDQFIANDTNLSEEKHTMLITGPNMAGKSTYMRQTALIAIMAQMGSFIPARAAKMPVIDRIFTRIGAGDDLTGGQSTFMMEMRDIQVMTERATPRSLVIIDELGRGTSTHEGMAIAQAVIEFLHNRIGCKTLVSTHFHELADLEITLPRLQNFRMAVKESGNEVTFLRKLVPGAASSSFGIYCARLAGLPESIITRANQLLEERLAADRRSAPVQLQLFIGEQDKREEQDRRNGLAEEVAEQLMSIDLMTTTPLAALNFLHELQQKLEVRREDRDGQNQDIG